MIEIYEQIPVKVQAIQFFDDTETRADIIDFLGRNFARFTIINNVITLRVRNYYNKELLNEFTINTGEYVIKENDGTVKSLTEGEFKNFYKKVWD